MFSTSKYKYTWIQQKRRYVLFSKVCIGRGGPLIKCDIYIYLLTARIRRYLRMYETYIPKKMFDLIRIPVLCDMKKSGKEINRIKDVMIDERCHFA